MIQVLEWTKTTCDVCRLLENDVSPKNCAYCNLCDSWICESDLPRWGRRARAALKRHLEPLYKGVPDVQDLYRGDPEADLILRGDPPSQS